MKLAKHIDGITASCSKRNARGQRKLPLGRLAALAAASAVLSAPALAQATLDVNNIWNLGNQTLTIAANTFPVGLSSFPASISQFTFPPGSAGPGGTGAILGGTVTYLAPNGNGCRFTTTITPVGASWIFSTSKAVVGSGTTTTCNYKRISTNSSTGELVAEWEISGY